MGFWSQNEQGESFASRRMPGVELVWGDGPADAIDSALNDIRRDFIDGMGREPSAAEIRAGLEFSLSLLIEDGEIAQEVAVNADSL